MAKGKTGTLKDRVVDAALQVIADRGVEQLSLREVARRLGVSHQAPYKHFPSRDHILAAVVARCFSRFSAHLEARTKGQDAFEELGNMGLAYLDFAQSHPLMYRLMFNTPLPDGADHPEMLAQAQLAFALLRDRLREMDLRDPGHPIPDPAKHDALFVWSALHGFASLIQSDALQTVGLNAKEQGLAMERMMRRISMAMEDGP